jgi:outer membrane biosynthesis protein TonB
MSLPVEVMSDSGRGVPLHVAPPRTVRVWMQRVTPAPPAAIAVGLPAAEPDTVSAEPLPAPALVVDEGLKPPIPRTRARIARTEEGGPASVDLDVRVGEDGAVTDARWAGGSESPALVAAARDCALAMRFYPALKDGKPIAVWCRQRFDFGSAR